MVSSADVTMSIDTVALIRLTCVGCTLGPTMTACMRVGVNVMRNYYDIVATLTRVMMRNMTSVMR